jgi:hypothetical protein
VLPFPSARDWAEGPPPGLGAADGALEPVKNGLFFSSKYGSEMAVFNPPHVICFANFKPKEVAMSADRWKVSVRLEVGAPSRRCPE